MSNTDKKVLVADDEKGNIEILQVTLKNHYRVIVATSGEKALELAQKHEPDLILLDIMMPGMDGYEVCKRLKNDPALAMIPVIFVTAMSEVEDETKGFDLGAVDYITKPVSPHIVLRRVETHLSLVQAESLEALARSAIHMLGEAGHFNDTDTGQHIWRMAAYARALAEAAGWSVEQAEMLELAAPMHDMGKIGIPDAILKAPRKLKPEEWETMMTHSKIGANILSKSNNPVFVLASEIALSHHEKWDGSGYPSGLSREEIPESARIVAIADIFDALTIKRSYKEPWSIEDALMEIKKSAGRQLDLRLVEFFLSIEEKIRHIKTEWDSKEQEG
ncbi:MAG: response regulator [Candidatus Thiodiazotropha sp. (ex Lucinoma kastoroae)]|nr:response regulator [Candidatus Thiodiazotropha sp. (ex Lucinoma kastoroae)]